MRVWGFLCAHNVIRPAVDGQRGFLRFRPRRAGGILPVRPAITAGPARRRVRACRRGTACWRPVSRSWLPCALPGRVRPGLCLCPQCRAALRCGSWPWSGSRGMRAACSGRARHQPVRGQTGSGSCRRSGRAGRAAWRASCRRGYSAGSLAGLRGGRADGPSLVAGPPGRGCKACGDIGGSGGPLGCGDRASLPGRPARYRVIWLVCPRCGADDAQMFYDERDLPLCAGSADTPHGPMELQR